MLIIFSCISYSVRGLCHAVLDSVQVGVDLVSIPASLFGCLPLQDHQTVQHKSKLAMNYCSDVFFFHTEILSASW